MTRRRVAGVVCGLTLVTAVAVLPGVGSSSAAFTDAEYARTTVTASSPPVPVPEGCTATPLVSTYAVFHWSAPPGLTEPYSYQWQVLGPDGYPQAGGMLPSTTTEQRIDASELGIAETRVFRVRVVMGGWEGPWLEGEITTVLSIGGISLIGSCSWN